MNIPFRQRQLIIEVEKSAPAIPFDAALEGASDREVERFVRKAHSSQEPRWESHALLYGFHI